MDVLGALGRAADASRVYVFQNHELPGQGLAMSQRYEWTAPHASAEIDNPTLQNLPYEESGLGRWVPILESGRPLVGRRQDFPEGEWEILALQGIQSLALVPIHVDNRWWGFIGVDECRHERVWSEAEITSLRAAADTLGAAIERDQALAGARSGQGGGGGGQRGEIPVPRQHEPRDPYAH